MKRLFKNIAIGTFTLCSIIANAQSDKSLLWEISGNGLQKPSYVFGTIHMICSDNYIMTEKIENTLKNVDAYYAEINFADSAAANIMQGAMISETPLSKRLTEAKYNELKTLLKEVVNIDIAQVENFTEAGIASMITFKSFPCSDFKMYEIQFLQAATAQQKKLGGLETAEQQMELLNKTLGADATIEMLKDLQKNGFKTNKEMINLYTSQDIQGLYDFMKTTTYMTEEIYNEMLTKRNTNWVTIMPNIMKNESVFFAVGAAHLSGDTGVLKLLKDAGYNLKPISIK